MPDYSLTSRKTNSLSEIANSNGDGFYYASGMAQDTTHPMLVGVWDSKTVIFSSSQRLFLKLFNDNAANINTAISEYVNSLGNETSLNVAEDTKKTASTGLE